MNIYTNSMLKDWQTCHNKYYFKYIRKIIIPKREEFFELGKKVHALISYHLNGFDTTILENSSSEEAFLHYKSILNHPIMKLTSFLSEWGFNVQIGNSKNMFIGRIDAIFFDEKNKKYTIADWKTGMKIPENPILEPQTQIYLYAFYKSQRDLGIKIKPEDINFKFIQTPSLNETSINFSEELLNEFEKNFLKQIAEIKNASLQNLLSDEKKCNFCEYRFMCQKISSET